MTPQMILDTPLGHSAARLRHTFWASMGRGADGGSAAWVLRWLWSSDLRPLVAQEIDLADVLERSQGYVVPIQAVANQLTASDVLSATVVELGGQGVDPALLEMLTAYGAGLSPVHTVRAGAALLVLAVGAARRVGV